MKSAGAWVWLFWFYLWGLAFGYAKAFCYTEDAGTIFAAIAVFLLSTAALGVVTLLWYLLARRFVKGTGRTTVPNKPMWILLAISTCACIVWLYPLSMYHHGLRFEWEYGSGASGDYAIIHSYRLIDGQMIPGPECDGLGPLILFSDRNGDGRRDLVCYGDGFERAVFGLVDPYAKGQPAFQLIRGGAGINYPQAGLYGN